MANNTKNSNVFKYDCNVCIFNTDDKKEFPIYTKLGKVKIPQEVS